MKSINFILGTVLQATVNTPDYVIEQSYREKYFPLFKAIKAHPHLKLTCHICGHLLTWLEKYHHEFIDLLKELLKKGQLELLGGGYYDPLLPLIPSCDRRGQIKLLNDQIKKLFRIVPTGVWLTKQAYAKEIITDLAELGMEYLILSDFHLNQAQTSSQDLGYPLVLDNFGKTIKALSINEPLLRLVDHAAPDKIVLYLKKIAAEGGQRSATIFCEPNFSEEYLHNLAEFIKANLTWLKVVKAADYFEEVTQAKKVFVREQASPLIERYAEGPLQNFFTKYPEINHLYKRMLQVSAKIQSLRLGQTMGHVKEREQKIQQAEIELYKAQNFAAYVLNESGGFFLKAIREKTYAHLIGAEEILAALTHGNQNYCDLLISDVDGDANDEIQVVSQPFHATISPSYGGALLELDYQPKKINLINTLQTDGGHLRKVCFLDYVLAPETDLNEFKAGKAKFLANFTAQNYGVLPQRKKGGLTLKLTREEPFGTGALRVTKTISFYAGQSQILAEYQVENISKRPVEFRFGSEFCLSGINDKRLTQAYDIEGINRVRLFDDKDNFSVLLTLDKVAAIWRYPIETSVKVEGKTVKLNQGLVIFPNWQLNLKPDETHTFTLKILVEQ